MFSRINQSYNCSNISEEDFDRQQNLSSSRNLYSNNTLQCDQFSFKQIKYGCQQNTRRSYQKMFYKSQSSFCLKENLQNLSKSEIIQLLIQEINSTQQKNNYKNESSDTFGDAFSIRNGQMKYKKQYQELVKGFEEYINNTQQAQQHYIKVIDDLKKQNKFLQSQLSSQQTHFGKPLSYMAHSHTLQKPALIISRLQQTVQNYTQINNELINKVQKLQRINKQLMGENFTLEEENQSLEQDNLMMDKENQKLIKENTAFKSIVDELKDYIIQRREVKQQAVECTERQRACKVVFDENPLDEKKIVFLSKDSEDSIINSSEIRKQEHTLNDSTIMFEKDSNTIPRAYVESKGKKQHPYENSLSYQSASFQTAQLNATTSRMIQIQNKELKLTNLKLQQLLERKGSKVNLLLDEIQMLREEKIITNQEVAELKCKLKKLQSCGESTMGSKCTTDESKVSVGSMARDVGHHLNDKKQSYKESYDDLKIVKSISSSSYPFRKFQLDSFKTLTKTNSDESPARKQNMYEQKVKNRVQRLLSKQSNSRQNDSINGQTEVKIQQFYVPKTLLASNKKN